MLETPIYNVHIISKGVAGHPDAIYPFTDPVLAFVFARETRSQHKHMISSITIYEQRVDMPDDFWRARKKCAAEIVFVTKWPDSPIGEWTEEFSHNFRQTVEELAAKRKKVA